MIRQSKIGAGILGLKVPSDKVVPKKVAIGTVTAIASIVPIRAVAISSPIANAISLPLNHFGNRDTRYFHPNAKNSISERGKEYL